jgi:glycosyltransferase involved in cell wall biosynthesis
LSQGISIIICCYNSKNRIATTLQAILRLQLPVEIPVELIIVDNASTDGTADYVLDILKQGHPAFAYSIVPEQKAGLIFARMTGIQTAQYDTVLFVDDDNELRADYLLNGLACLRDHPDVGALGGFSHGVFKEKLPVWMNPGFPFKTLLNSLAVTSSDTATVGYLDDVRDFVFGASSFYRKAILDKLSNTGYQLKLSGRSGDILLSGDDQELCFIARMAGYRLYRSDALHFNHHIDSSRIDQQYFLRLFTGFGYSSVILENYHDVVIGRSASNANLKARIISNLKVVIFSITAASLGRLWPSKFFKFSLLKAFQQGRLTFLQQNPDIHKIYQSIDALKTKMSDNPSAV